MVQVGWSATLIAAVVVALVPLLRIRTVAALCLAALLGGLLVRTASTGNVHWGRAALAAGVAALLLAPALLDDLSNYPGEAGGSLSLLSLAGPIPWAAVVLSVTAFLIARTRYAWGAASVAVLAAVPRLQLYYLT
jgi:hypothetical protein